MKNDIINAAKLAAQEIESIFTNQAKVIEVMEEAARLEAWEYEKQARELQSKAHHVRYMKDEAVKALRDGNIEAAKGYRSQVTELERVLQLLHIAKTCGTSDLSLVANNRSKFIECIDEPMNNEFIHICAYIYQTDKKVNKYTLCIVSKSIFERELIGYNWGSVQPYFEGSAQRFFEFDIKSAPTVQELKDFYFKKGSDSFWKAKEFAALVEEYKEVVNECNTPEWEHEYLLSRKKYFEDNYGRFEDVDEYKEVLKKLAE